MTTKEFFEKVMSDEALRKKMHEIQTVEEGYAIARELGVTDDQQTFLSEMMKYELAYLRESGATDLPDGELPDEDLLNVAGGNEGSCLGYLAACGCI